MTAQIIDLGNLSAADGFAIIGEPNQGAAGSSVSATGDVNGDGIDDLLVGASGAAPNEGTVYVIFGKAGSARAAIDLANLAASDGYRITGDASGDYAGRSVAIVGDVNGDGIGDILIGAPGGDNGGDRAGEAYVVFGVAGSTRSDIDLTNLPAADGFVIQGDAAGDWLGLSVSSAGDVNGDGLDDLIIGAQFGTYGVATVGEAYVIFGRSGINRSSIDLTSLAPEDGFVIRGDNNGDQAGTSVSRAGDVNGDGLDDLIVGAPRGDNGGLNAGEAYVIFGKSGATRANIDLTTFAASDGFIIQGDVAQDRAGYSVSNAGDINGDGIDDLLVGARFGGNGGVYAGEVYVIFGKSGATRTSIDLTTLVSSDGFIIQGDVEGDRAGYSIAAAGDVNGDGVDDIIVGAAFGDDGTPDGGEAYVIFGKVGATRPAIDLTNLSLNDGLILTGDLVGGAAGFSVSGGGDLNQDGLADLVVGAPRSNSSGTVSGTAYVIYGSDRFGAVNGTSGADSLSGTEAADILNGFAGGDVLDGGAGADLMRGGAGDDVYVIDHVGDRAVELVGDGVDRIDTNLSIYTLAANLEDLRYTGSGLFTGTGNGSANVITGGNQSDTLNGLGGNDVLEGGGGADRLFGGTGADTMIGGDGNDRIVVDQADDIAIGGQGADTVQFSAANLTFALALDIEIASNQSGGALTLTLNALANTYGGSAGSDIATLGDGGDSAYGRGGADRFYGENGNDYLFGEAGDDILDGAMGADYLYGGGDNDSLSGRANDDILYGQSGTDVLDGGVGRDLLYGGDGNDIFLFDDGNSGATVATADRIMDFAGGDRIDLSAIDAVAGSPDSSFTFIGASAFSGVSGQLRYQFVGAETLIYGDLNGDGVSDLAIRILGNVSLTADAFTL